MHKLCRIIHTILYTKPIKLIITLTRKMSFFSIDILHKLAVIRPFFNIHVHYYKDHLTSQTTSSFYLLTIVRFTDFQMKLSKTRRKILNILQETQYSTVGGNLRKSKAFVWIFRIFRLSVQE